MSEIPGPSEPLTAQAAQAAYAALPKEQQGGALTPATFRNLIDRMYEKRKLGALEVESMVRVLAAAGCDSAVRKVISTLSNDFVGSTQGNYKKGGLIALAATAVALGPSGIGKYFGAVAAPVLGCLQDPDTRVRYYALESFYNVAKVARTGVLALFNNVFDSCCRLAADPDNSVRSASQMLDTLVKDIVTQQPGAPFDLERFVPLLKRRVLVTHPNARHFLISWLGVLDSVPDIDIAKYLPDFLDGLLEYLVDPVHDISTETAALLREFLKELVTQQVDIDMPALLKILIARLKQATEQLRAPARRQHSQPSGVHGRSNSISGEYSRPATARPTPSLRLATEPSAAAATTGALTDREPLFPSSRKQIVLQPPPQSPLKSQHQQQQQQQQGQEQQGLEQQQGAQQASQQQQQSQQALQQSQQQPSWNQSSNSSGGNGGSGSRRNNFSAIEPITFTVLEWLSTLVQHASKPDARFQTDFLSQGPLIVEVLLPLVARDDLPVAEEALHVNERLVRFVEGLPADKVQPFLGEYLEVALQAVDVDNTQHSRVTGLRWLEVFHAKFGEALLPHAERLFPALLKSLADRSDAILAAAMRLTGALSASDAFFEREMASLAHLFLTDTGYMRERAAKILRLLCTYTDAERVYMSLGRILAARSSPAADPERTAETVQILNVLLLSLQETRLVRRKLATHANSALFETLHRAWAYSPASLFALCLLSQSYTHAAAIAERFAELDVTLPFLLELDQIVQLFESPAFVQQRTQLLRPQQHPDLVRAMYNLLMVLPQSQAYTLLEHRLTSAARFAQFQLKTEAPSPAAPAQAADASAAGGSTEGYAPDYEALLADFVKVQGERAAIHASRTQQDL